MRPSAVSRRRPAFMDRSATRRHRPDYVLLVVSVLLMSVGLVVVYAISPGLSAVTNVDEQYYATKQLAAIALGLVVFAVFAHLPVKALKRLQMPLIIAAGVAALAVRLFGEEVNGAYRWIQFGSVSFQAVELIKFALLIALAAFLTERVREGNLADRQKTIKPLVLVLAGVALVVAKFQSDLGSTGVIAAMFCLMIFAAGLPMKRILQLGAIIIIGTALLIASSPYRRERLTTFLHPERDCQASGYQACQALIAIGSGGLTGRGLGRSVQAYGYLPEAANDSIFAVIAEKFGFVGVTAIIGLFVTLFARLKRIIERSSDTFSRLIVTGILAWLSTQALINIGAMIGLLPLKGITLPLISYGGTSIIFVMAAIGVAFEISRYTSYSTVTTSNLTTGRQGAYGYRSDRRGLRGAYYSAASRRA